MTHSERSPKLEDVTVFGVPLIQDGVRVLGKETSELSEQKRVTL